MHSPFQIRSLLSSCRPYTTTAALRSKPLHVSPAPPRLPKEEQELFERLQRASAGAFSTPKPTFVTNPALSSVASKTSSSLSTSSSTTARSSSGTVVHSESDTRSETTLNARIDASGHGEELHPDIRRGSPPEFEGERNPKTGEVGGPKNEPLRWGTGGDWSYNGRATDF